VFSIFIDSITMRAWPLDTESPVFTLTVSTRPGIMAFTPFPPADVCADGREGATGLGVAGRAGAAGEMVVDSEAPTPGSSTSYETPSTVTVTGDRPTSPTSTSNALPWIVIR
jgi:hypothetical protein